MPCVFFSVVGAKLRYGYCYFFAVSFQRFLWEEIQIACTLLVKSRTCTGWFLFLFAIFVDSFLFRFWNVNVINIIVILDLPNVLSYIHKYNIKNILTIKLFTFSETELGSGTKKYHRNHYRITLVSVFLIRIYWFF